MDTIAILIPLYNEEKSLNSLLQELKYHCKDISKRYEINFRIIFVDDGSTDKSLNIIKSMKNFNLPIQVISLSRNFGKEAAISAGLNAGKDDSAVLIMDADLQHPPKLINELVKKFKTEEFDMVYAFKQSRKKEGFISQQFSNIFYSLININNRYNIPKNAGDFRILSKKVVHAILQLPENERFMKGLYAWVGYTKVGVPYLPEDRTHGKTFFSLWRLLFLSIDGITSFSVTPLRMMSIFGLIISFLSVVYFSFIIFERLFLNTSTPGHASIFVLISFFGGVQLLCLGVIGEYIGKILLEAKRRPAYLIKENLIISKGNDN